MQSMANNSARQSFRVARTLPASFTSSADGLAADNRNKQGRVANARRGIIHQPSASVGEQLDASSGHHHTGTEHLPLMLNRVGYCPPDTGEVVPIEDRMRHRRSAGIAIRDKRDEI